MQNDELRLTLLQYDIAWEDKSKNIAYISNTVGQLTEETDIVVLPEMCTTAFSFNVEKMGENMEGETITQIKKIAEQNNIAICGSFIARENDKHYNRAFFITPSTEYYYDKRHLFRMGGESENFTAGDKKTIIQYKGFNICMLVCYDLRFPVWARNVDKEYDLLIYVANWPEARREVWKTLLPARAIENMSFVCGVNRVGKNDNELNHAGESMVVNPRGQKILEMPANKECASTVTICKEILTKDRERFPVWKDADKFEIL